MITLISFYRNCFCCGRPLNLNDNDDNRCSRNSLRTSTSQPLAVMDVSNDMKSVEGSVTSTVKQQLAVADVGQLWWTVMYCSAVTDVCCWQNIPLIKFSLIACVIHFNVKCRVSADLLFLNSSDNKRTTKNQSKVSRFNLFNLFFFNLSLTTRRKRRRRAFNPLEF